MPRAKTVDLARVVFFGPEQLQAQRLQAAVEDGASGEEVAALAQAASKGEYRQYLGEEIVEGVTQAKLGPLVQWVHLVDEEGNWEDEGKYVVFDGDEADYTPVVTTEDSNG